MIGIRVDGNKKIGTGHVMRCLSIAEALRGRGHAPVFISVDKNGLPEQQGFRCIHIDGVYSSLVNEQLLPLLRRENIHTLLVDTYFADAAYYKRLPEDIQTACIFDFGNACLPVDLLINYNISYANYQYPSDIKTLLGLAYVPLRQEFSLPQPPRQFERVRSLLITTGGTDPLNITSAIIRLLRAMPAFDSVTLQVVIGGLNIHKNEVRETAAHAKNVICHENIRMMSNLMQDCDIAISAGGSTVYELCACGIPSIVFSFVDNQDDMVRAMADAGIMLLAGNYRLNPEQCLSGMAKHAKILLEDARLRESLSDKGRALVDGQGAGRIANALLCLK
ncbi:MAG: UDP-2,4-diacetamido-2,4,6-trideoxy-beta-L-altropyranose hydrolase [Christensenellaceae bacterium]|jgi:UDP-2,4-diacetamido-2,4,6-trideoxy-beta-L-altropyranose hydrolase